MEVESKRIIFEVACFSILLTYNELRIISYKGTGSVSPTNANFADGSKWELANDNDSVSKTYVDDKLIPVARIISKG